MQGLLIDHLVEHRDCENTFFTLTCTICGAVWKSAALPGLTRKAAAEEAAKQIHMCPFCGRPVCDSCFVDVDGITLCAQCGKLLREKSRHDAMKKIVLSICNSLMAMSITHSLTQTGGFQIASIRPGCKEIARECADASADVLLMEAAFNIGATLDDCLKEATRLRSLRPECKTILLCDENSAPEVARRIALAKKDGLIDDFVYSSVSENYLTAMLYAI